MYCIKILTKWNIKNPTKYIHMYSISVKSKYIFPKKKLIRAFYHIANDLNINFMVDFLNTAIPILTNKIFLTKFLDYKFWIGYMYIYVPVVFRCMCKSRQSNNHCWQRNMGSFPDVYLFLVIWVTKNGIFTKKF